MLRHTLIIGAAFAALASSLYACGSLRNSEKANALANSVPTSTPIKYLVVIYNENVSFDHYFATYPKATNPPGEPAFTGVVNTPTINGLSDSLLMANPNLMNPANGTAASNPFRLDRTQAATADQNHAYASEQRAYNNGAADLFPKFTGNGSAGGADAFGTSGQVMGYFDGNTVTALWNYGDGSFAVNSHPSV